MGISTTCSRSSFRMADRFCSPFEAAKAGFTRAPSIRRIPSASWRTSPTATTSSRATSCSSVDGPCWLWALTPADVRCLVPPSHCRPGLPESVPATAGGDLAYRFDGTISAQLTWFARDGRRLGSVGSPGPYRQIALSPTGRRVVIQAGDLVSGGSQGDLFLLDFATGVRSRLTNDPASTPTLHGRPTNASWLSQRIAPDEGQRS